MKRGLFVVVVLCIVSAVFFLAWPGRSHNPAGSAPSGINRDADNAPSPTASRTPLPRPRATSTPVPTRVPTATPVAKLPEAAITKPKYLVLFVLDGAQPSYYDIPGIPHLRSLMKRGANYSNGFAGILESETPSGHATIASGSTPRKDGILSFAWANNDNTTVNLFDPNNIRNGQMEKILSAAPASDIATLVKHHDSTAKVVVLGGHKYYAQDALGGPNADVIVYYTGMPNGTFAPVSVPGHVPPSDILSDPSLTAKTTHLPMGVEDHMTMHLVQRAFEKMRPRTLLVNIPEFDWPLGHPDGAGRDPQGVKLLMQGFDTDLGKLEDAYRKAGILDQTLFVFTSDHGFAPIDHKISSTVIEKAVEQSGTRIISDTFHTAGYLWVQDSTKAAQAAENVAKLQNPYIQSVYFKAPGTGGSYEYLRASGADLFEVPGTEAANQYLLHTFSGPNGPDVVVFFTENSAALPGGESTWKGDHGGAAWNSQHLRIIFSGAGVKHGVTSDQPVPLMDIAPTALSMLGITPTSMEGTPLASSMLVSTSAQRSAEQAQKQALTPVITALRAESQAEVAAGK